MKSIRIYSIYFINSTTLQSYEAKVTSNLRTMLDLTKKSYIQNL